MNSNGCLDDERNSKCLNRIDEFENEIFKSLRAKCTRFYVKIPYDYKNERNNNQCSIWTLSVNADEHKDKTPVVLVHGYMDGLGVWKYNIDALSELRPLYAFDILGFGHSSRPEFSTDSIIVETQFVESIEEWRKAMKLDKMILLGHSFGGYLVTLYALKYPQNLSTLILKDPWGFPHPTVRKQLFSHLQFTKELIQFHIYLLKCKLLNRNASTLNNDIDVLLNYRYHINALRPSSGKKAFDNKFLNKLLICCAQRPLLDRFAKIDPNLRIVFIIGGMSWVNRSRFVTMAKCLRPTYSKTQIEIIEGAGHDIMIDKPNELNECLKLIFKNDDDQQVKLNQIK